jgi:hypothetical protein
MFIGFVDLAILTVERLPGISNRERPADSDRLLLALVAPAVALKRVGLR